MHEQSTNGKKILLIEDHPEMRHVISGTLRRLGYQLLEAEDGVTGIKMTVTEKPDLVLMNLSLPGLSGFEVTKKIKANPPTAHIPIVACSGWQEKRMVAKSFQAGVVEYLTKPFSAKKIAEVIGRLIGDSNNN